MKYAQVNAIPNAMILDLNLLGRIRVGQRKFNLSVDECLAIHLKSLGMVREDYGSVCKCDDARAWYVQPKGDKKPTRKTAIETVNNEIQKAKHWLEHSPVAAARLSRGQHKTKKGQQPVTVEGDKKSTGKTAKKKPSKNR